jgi:toxin ParE1/3/4
MPVRARLTPRAQREFHEALRWIAAERPSAARSLREATNALARLIAEHPMIGTTRLDCAPEPYRFAVVRGFPYLLVYDPTSRPPTIHRFVHGARDLPEVLKDL